MTIDTDINRDQSKRKSKSAIPTPEEIIAGYRERIATTSVTEMRDEARKYITDNTEFDNLTVANFALWLIDKALLREIKDPPPDITVVAKQRAESKAAKQKLADKLAAKVEKKIETEVHIRLMDYQTMYGKPLGDCTGAECERLSRRYGGFYAELAKRLTRAETVRAHMSEAELQSIARTYRMIGEKATR